MDPETTITARFEHDRARLRGVAYRMLGSLSEAEDAVQEAWLRLHRTDTTGVDNLSAWLTTVVARVCLNMLRARNLRNEEPLDTAPEPVSGSDPEQEALLADSVGLALLVVLDTLAPAERLAFVLHDLFAVPFAEIGPMIDRTPAAARQLASRARKRIKGAEPPDADPSVARRVADAYLAAIRSGDFDALVRLLDADVVLRADRNVLPSGMPVEIRGADAVAKAAMASSQRAQFSETALIDGVPGLVMAPRGKLFLVLAFAYRNDKISAIDVVADPDRLRDLDLAVLD